MKVEIIRVLPNEDWVIVNVNGEQIHAGHEIPDFVWMELLGRLGVKTKLRKVHAHDLGVCAYDCDRCDPLTPEGDPGIV